jgi:hypothetical protein
MSTPSFAAHKADLIIGRWAARISTLTWWLFLAVEWCYVKNDREASQGTAYNAISTAVYPRRNSTQIVTRL